MLQLFGLDPSSYTIAINLFIRLLGAIYVIAYVPFLFQIEGLIGDDGILPISNYLSSIKRLGLGFKRFTYFPTILWFNASNRALKCLVWTGIALGTLLMFGVNPPLMLLLLYIVHLSLTTAGQDFMCFGWETFLMEITLSAFLLTATVPYNIMGWINLNFLLFRFHIAAGASKLLSHDPNWRNLTAMAYHYLSQPLPNTAAWYVHKLPLWFHKLSTWLMFYIELVVPFIIFAPPELRLLAFIQLAGLQVFIWLTGNFSYLNYLTVVFCLILLDNQYLEPFLSEPPILEPSGLLWQMIMTCLGVVMLGIQVATLWFFFFRSRLFVPLITAIQPFHIAYRHGIFAVMTTKRYEIVVEGSDDGNEWKEYHFYYKPTDLAWRPRRIAPYQPRIDWQMWFLPFEYFDYRGWFQKFLVKLLQNSPSVLKLIRQNPFPNKPPRYIRALQYDYEYTSYEEKSKTGHWWKRELIDHYTPEMELRENSF